VHRATSHADCLKLWKHNLLESLACPGPFRDCFIIKYNIRKCQKLIPPPMHDNEMWARIAQLVQQLALGWTVRKSNPSGGEIFCTHPDRPWGQPSLLYNWYQVFPRDKVAREWHCPPTPISAKVEGRVELYIYSPSRCL